jgi:hypothetical protein
MFAISQQLNNVNGSLHSLQGQLNQLKEQVQTMKNVQSKTIENDPNMKLEKLSESFDELKKLVNKVQLDLVTKYNELKKDIDTSKKEIILIDTTISHKIDQIVKKIVKDRTDLIAEELKSFVERSLSEYVDNSEKDKDDDVDVEDVEVFV